MPAKQCAFCGRPLGRYTWKASGDREFCNEFCASGVEDGFIASPPLDPYADAEMVPQPARQRL